MATTFIPPAPPAPPEIRGQQAPMGPQVPAFIQAGQATAQPPMDPVSLLQQKVAELEVWASDAAQLIAAVHPPLGALLVPIAQAGKAMQDQVQQLGARRTAASPQMPAAEAVPSPALM